MDWIEIGDFRFDLAEQDFLRRILKHLPVRKSPNGWKSGTA